MNSVLDHVMAVTAQYTPARVTADADFVRDLGLDSLDLVEITTVLDEKYGPHDWEAYFAQVVFDSANPLERQDLTPRKFAEWISSSMCRGA